MDSANDHSVDPCYRLLALCARADPHPLMDEQLKDYIESFTAWIDLPGQAELHGMGPLLWHHIRRLDLAIPHETKKILSGLYLRQRVFQRAQVQVLLEITSLLAQHNIRAVVLKGLALAHEYYLDPVLRPSSDIDLLLKKEDIFPALSFLEKNNYKIPVLTDVDIHSEWIVESPLQNGLSVRIELHHLSDDEFIGFDSPPHKLQINGQMIYVPHFMDHVDYLIRHLVRHLFVATSTKPLPLKWLADIVSVVERHAEEIDWEKRAALLNRLEVMYSLTPLPDHLSNVIPIKRIPIPHGVNQYPQGWPQHKLAEWRQVGLLNYLKKTFSPPSSWWLCLQYGIDKEAVFWHGRVIYPLQILKMVWKMFSTTSKSKLQLT
jgi:hypothetical protein